MGVNCEFDFVNLEKSTLILKKFNEGLMLIIALKFYFENEC